MNIIDILQSGHDTVLATAEAFPSDAWEQPGACGVWSAKDVIAHLASFEAILVDTLRGLVKDEPMTPLLDSFVTAYETFNDSEVEARRDQSFSTIVEAYTRDYFEAIRLLTELPEATLRQNGVLDWYGDIYDLEDFLVYTYYGHKREHCAQIQVFRDQLVASPVGENKR